MRTALRDLRPGEGEEFAVADHHFGLTYDAYSPPLKGEGKVDEEQREKWFRRCEQMAVTPDYARFYARWKGTFVEPHSRIQEVKLASRLLVGHGNPSGSDVGLTVHRIWGAPMIPGSGLKGLLANYVDAVLGPSREPERDPPEEREKRDDWQGVIWDKSRIVRAPGKHYREMFGSPAVDAEAGAERQGRVQFHEALYVPGSAANDRPFAADVLTVHQKTYYRESGAKPPTDWDSPNPVGFITIKPGVKLLLALSGPADWTDLAMALLLEALEHWGAGGKTAAGYGRAQPA